MVKTVEVKVFGKVQGVGFRFSSYEKFVELSLQGQAENLPDGSVRVVMTGEEENLKLFLRWAQKGPQGARVEKMDYKVVPETENQQPQEDFGI